MKTTKREVKDGGMDRKVTGNDEQVKVVAEAPGYGGGVRCMVCWEKVEGGVEEKKEARWFYEDYVQLTMRNKYELEIQRIFEASMGKNCGMEPGICKECRDGMLEAIREWVRKNDAGVKLLKSKKVGKRVYEDGGDDDEGGGDFED